ncbi:SPW repeat domain-containing protein [Halalkalicoccus salilacus]|uniref:SPW repeat domain-containing protein n=1 Tax=Halalkalicoccus salilacus TaxID=3117459 RepID=UPI00300F6914
MSNTPTDTEPTTGTEANRERLDTDTMQWISAIVAIAGLGLVAYPFMFEATEAAIWNDTLVGTAIFLLGGYNFYRLTRDQLANVAVASLATLLGLWALVFPAVIEMGSNELAMATAAGGLITAVLSAYSAYANGQADTPKRTPARA